MTHEKDERINVGAGVVPTYHATESVEEARAVVESCCSATEDLRRMLDERGVEWKKHELDSEYATMWHASDGTLVSASQIHGKRVTLFWDLTPKQAIAATLGPGECRFKTVERFIDARRSRADMCECDRCGYRCARGFIQDERFKYCPNCGAKVVSE